MRGPLADRRIVLLLLASTISTFGDFALSIALGVWVRELTGSTAQAGMCFLMTMLGSLTSPLSGLVVDRVPRRRLMIGTYLGTAALLMLLMRVRGPGDVWLVFVVAFLYGVSATTTGSAQLALVRELVPEDRLATVNGIQQTASQALRLIAPLVGVGLLAWVGGHAVVAMDAVTFVVAVACLWFVDVDHSSSAAQPPGRLLAEPAAGVRLLMRSALMRQVLAASAVLVLAVGFFETVALQVVTVGLGHAPTWLSLLVTMQGAGGVLGAAVSGFVVRRTGDKGLVVAGMSLMVAMSALFAVPAAAAVLTGACLGGVALSWLVVGTLTILQKNTPNASMGRVMGAAELALSVPQSIGIGLGALLVDVVFYRFLCVAAAAAICAATLYLATRRSERGAQAAPSSLDTHDPSRDCVPADLREPDMTEPTHLIENEPAYLVVLNHEEQYSVWPADRPLPAGWRAEGFEGPKDDCLTHIEKVWVDMRPLSLRTRI